MSEVELKLPDPATSEADQDLDAQDRLPLRARAFISMLRFVDNRQRQKMAANSLREAKDYEDRADQLTDAERVQRGLYLLRSGRAYTNADSPYAAAEVLEEAQPDIETYKMQGSLDGFLALANLFQSMEYAYKTLDRHDQATGTRDKARVLAQEIEENFGIHTDFLADGTRMQSRTASM